MTTSSETTQGPAATRRQRRPDRDRLLNLFFAALAALVVVALVVGIAGDLDRPADRSVAEHWTRMAADVANLAFFALVTVLLIERRQPLAKASGLLPRLTAVIGSFLLTPVVLLTDLNDRVWLVVVGLVLTAGGSMAAVYSLAHLGRSFSVMAEARKLVTTGPYGVVRHPLYVFEQIAVVGIAVSHLSWLSVLALVVHIGFQVRRALNEEAILAATFPDDYEAYADRTARFIPGVH